ncbi:hypothetical protein RPQ02_00805 [Streptomyces sp. AM2-3-1]|uniref:hypothetical protein n=1 Tax=Streptomyces sp. AM2-3-1 TaxID=3075824 RepID=UPI0028C4651D|nr:hypothetical protein [Streptomyces sp. AM2-3-1]WNO62445.1 hypothetical protein RPQ02_00805 [Streptomyces sp. AM2-3-1]
MTDYLAAAMAMLGPAQNRHADPAAWDRLHAELGIQLPPDYRIVVDAFAPIQINGHLYLSHPATERWNLGQHIRGQIQAWSEVPWDDLDLDADEDPRQLFGLDELSFGTRNGAVADREHRPRRDHLPAHCHRYPKALGEL